MGAMSDEIHALVEARLRRIDLRYTAGRRAIVAALMRSDGPVSITDIADRLPSLPRSSAYRHLVDLQSAGVVRRISANDEFARFELAEELTEHHHHFLCTECGKVMDVTPSSTFEKTLTRHLEALADAAGFQPHGHRIDVVGLCSSCR